MRGMPDTIRHRKLDGWEILHTPDVSDSQLQAWLTLARHWTPEQGPAQGERLSGAEIFRLQSPLGTITIKHKHYRGLKGLLSRLGLREPPLRRSFRLGCLARERGLHTPTPLAFLQRKTLAGTHAFLITRYLETDRPWRLLDAPAEEVDTMLMVMGREVAAWHLNGLRNRDLKGPNLLYDNQQCELYIIDLDGTHEIRPIPGLAVRGQDLGRLKAGAMAAGLDDTRWQTLLDAYLQAYPTHGTVAPPRETLATIIDARAARKFRRYQRQKRLLS